MCNLCVSIEDKFHLSLLKLLYSQNQHLENVLCVLSGSKSLGRYHVHVLDHGVVLSQL